ncbi:MAG: radical SAM protein [Acidobacteriota bacterium]
MSCVAGGEPVTFLSASRGMCRACRRMVRVRYVARGHRVFLERTCPEHGVGRALVAESVGWYLAAMQRGSSSRPPPRSFPKRAECPHDCGPCSFHAQACHLPVVSITNACDLRCPICFTYNRADRTYFMSRDEFVRQLDFVIEASGGVDLINITGGEPTSHPQLFDLIEAARRTGIGRVTLNTNGLRLARELDMVERLAELGAYVVLSLDTLDPRISFRMHGRDIVAEKLRALELLDRFGVQTTLLMVLAGGVNEGELGRLIDILLERSFIRSLTIQTMTYTGRGGGTFRPREHIPVDGVTRRVEEASGGRIRQRDFLPLPSAHPLCYSVAYFVADGRGGARSLLGVLDRSLLERHLTRGYLLDAGAELEEALRLAIDRVWSEGDDPGLLKTMKDVLGRVFPPGETLDRHERQRRAEQAVKTVYVHSHMDEDTYEIGRAMRCPDQVPVDGEKLIGACNYNLFYRQNDERFWVEAGVVGKAEVQGPP